MVSNYVVSYYGYVRISQVSFRPPPPAFETYRNRRNGTRRVWISSPACRNCSPLSRRNGNHHGKKGGVVIVRNVRRVKPNRVCATFGRICNAPKWSAVPTFFVGLADISRRSALRRRRRLRFVKRRIITIIIIISNWPTPGLCCVQERCGKGRWTGGVALSRIVRYRAYYYNVRVIELVVFLFVFLKPTPGRLGTKNGINLLRRAVRTRLVYHLWRSIFEMEGNPMSCVSIRLCCAVGTRARIRNLTANRPRINHTHTHAKTFARK